MKEFLKFSKVALGMTASVVVGLYMIDEKNNIKKVGETDCSKSRNKIMKLLPDV